MNCVCYILGQGAEEPLPAGGSCLLGSINLSEFVIEPFTKNAVFNFKEFTKAVATGVIALNEVLHEGLRLHPLEEQRESVNKWRQIGLGIMGWHDALIKLGIRYGSQESIALANKIGFEMANTAILQSAYLTSTYGTYPGYNRDAILSSPYFLANTTESTRTLVQEVGLANSQLLTIAPTGSIGTMLNISTGIEPIYNISYTRKTESLHGKDTYYKVYTPIVEQYMKLNNIQNEEDLPDFINTAMTLDYKERLEMQAAWQKHIDASISSTVNVPNSFTIEEVEQLYMTAWQKGLKGVTIFRDGCARLGILTNEPKKDEENRKDQKLKDILEWGTTIESSDDLIGKKRKIMSGCGSVHVQAWFDPINGKLTEVYLSKGSTGGCNSWMISNSRTMSLALRTGASFDYLIDQLKSSPACASYSVRTATKRDTSSGNCCPAAVANALVEMQKEIFDELGIDEEDTNIIKKDQPVRAVKDAKKCPECGAELQFSGGCNSCHECGYSRCE